MTILRAKTHAYFALLLIVTQLIPAFAQPTLSSAPQSSLKDVRTIVGRSFLHTVKPGETLFSIARQYGLAVDHLAYANGFPPTAVAIDPAVVLIIPKERILPANPPRDGLVLNLPERGLYLFRQGRFDRFVPVSIGSEDGFATPTGNFHIIERITNPTWYPPAWAKDRRPVPPGPNNPLGQHWIGLSLPRTGIHGTNQPLNIGNSVTHGCIRAYPQAVQALYNDVKIGWPVRIEYETVKIGRDAQGRLKVVTFADVYKKQSPGVAVKKRLGSAIAHELAPLVGLNLGVPLLVTRRSSLLEEVRAESQAPSGPTP